MNKLRFAELSLSDAMLRAVEDMGFEEATPIQTETIPYMLDGKDVIGHSQTGTGKTAAFAIPIIERLDLENPNIQAIVLCPTRELVIQVTGEFRKLTKYMENVRSLAVYGGQAIDRQFKLLEKNPQVIIGTPGRTIDHINRGTIKLHDIRFVVLDEADEMLDMGFREDIELILTDTPHNRQTVMFSATMPITIQKMMKQYQKSPIKIDLTNQKLDSPKIEQVYFEVQEKTKPEALSRLIDLHNIKLALVFCNTKVQVDNLVETLKTRGYFADGLHGDMTQKMRDRVMQNFRNGSVEILVATDVAGRGIDVSDIEAVINYDLPQDDEDYIHRIGRTARAGKQGVAFTFVVGRQMYNLKRIEKTNNIKITRKQIPSIDDLDEIRLKTVADQVKEVLEGGHIRKFTDMAEEVMGEDFTALDVAAALLKISFESKAENYDPSLKFDDKYEIRYEDKYPDKRNRGRSSDNRGSYNRESSYDRNRRPSYGQTGNNSSSYNSSSYNASGYNSSGSSSSDRSAPKGKYTKDRSAEKYSTPNFRDTKKKIGKKAEYKKK